MKSRTDKKLAGVCGGLAKHLGINSTIMRLIFVAAVFLSSSTFILVYIAMAFVMPKEPISEMDDFK
ncbi:MAG: PspC domain-containing protein [Balneolaceae bacterium]|nr:PspC domain-containing protein [Balneolaceae bacterium]